MVSRKHTENEYIMLNTLFTDINEHDFWHGKFDICYINSIQITCHECRKQTRLNPVVIKYTYGFKRIGAINSCSCGKIFILEGRS